MPKVHIREARSGTEVPGGGEDMQHLRVKEEQKETYSEDSDTEEEKEVNRVVRD